MRGRRVVLRPLETADLPAAEALLAARHRRHRAAEPLLGDGDVAEALRRAWSAAGARGVAADEDGQLAGYLIGAVGDSPYFGRHALVGRGGWAARDPERIRDLYAEAARAWVDDGARLHLAVSPAVDELLDPWVRLGFGRMQVAAIRESGAERLPPPRGVVVRRGGLDDLEPVVRPLADAIWRHQRLSPTFTGVALPSWEELRRGWEETLAEPGAALFVLERDGRPLGQAVLYPEDDDFVAAEDVVHLSTLVIDAAARGHGLGLVLSSHVLAWTAEGGYRAVTADWRETNLLASRFWPSRGFRPIFHRLHRVVEIG